MKMPLEQERLAVTHYWALSLWQHSSWQGVTVASGAL